MDKKLIQYRIFRFTTTGLSDLWGISPYEMKNTALEYSSLQIYHEHEFTALNNKSPSVIAKEKKSESNVILLV